MPARRPFPAAALGRAAFGALVAGAAAAQDVSFPRDVLPLLSDRCFPCHGPDARARKAGLRLDEAASAFAPRDGGAAVVPGRPERSQLIARITAADPDDRMPPADSGLSLSAAEVARLRSWIAAGARWELHWAFVPPVEPPLPEVRDRTWPRGELDRFVLARLEAEGRRPNAAADPAALLRRVTLDLTGLPPSPAELDAFVADPSDAAYERVVDRLLASPRYGERMAWPWLEAARYADTDGYQADPVRTVWPWRDWLVQALDDDLPFDRFTIAVLAGDRLPDATPEQRLATAFLRHNAHNGEGGRIPAETRIENGFDRTETVATVFMGLTFECARCHDHKFDPIAQRDYYRLFAFFDQSSETGAGRTGGELAPVLRWLPDPAARRRAAELTAALAAADAALSGDDPALDAAEAAWAGATAAAVARAHAEMVPATLGPWLVSERFPPPEGGVAALFGEPFAPEQAAAIASAARAGDGWRPEERLVDGVPLPLDDGRYAVYFARTITAGSARRMTVALGSDDAIKVWCNGALVLQNDVRRAVAPDQERVELALEAGENRLLLKIVNSGGPGGVAFRRVDETVAELPAEVARALARPAEQRDAAARAAVRRHFRRLRVADYGAREAERRALDDELAAIERSGVAVSVFDELPADRRRTTHVLERGNYLAPREVVAAGTPAFLPPLPVAAGAQEPPDRLALARWLVSGQHPLTARVAVNRAWQTFFGRGLVATSEDFGRQGERPSHPELLDWLACRFVASGWRVKALHRAIVTSATYRQAAAADADAFADDPHNVRLARSARHRLPAWMLRDQALALSGRLVERIGGPPVRPYQPAGVWAEATFGQIRYEPDGGDAPYRRSLYVFWRRIVGPTVLFDAPARQACVVRTAATNTPLHALATRNEPGFVESARGLAERAFGAADAPAARIAWLFRAATARAPDEAELARLTARFAASRAHFAADPAAATALLGVGDSRPDPALPAAELAALTTVAAVVLNLDEVLTRP